MEIKKFKDSLIDLKTMLEVMEKIEISERLEIEKIEGTTKKVLKELEIIKIDELALKNRKITKMINDIGK